MGPVVKVSALDLILSEIQVLENINLSINAGETLVLMGKNGCGKTVLLKTICGLFEPNVGTINLFDQDINKLSGKELNGIKQKFGYVFQKSGLFDSMSVAENVMFGLKRFQPDSPEKMRQRATDCLEKSGLRGAEEKLPSELSGGMKKRAALARAIATNPLLLLLDDPAAGLDPVLTDAIADVILELKADLNAATIVITHDLKLAEKLADKVSLMISGKIHCTLAAEDFFTSKDEAVIQFREGALTGPIKVIE
jgi:phospholipid/cholesterol/gamma-HCH transport system ATP-binding protein